MTKPTVVIIGGGVIGLSTAYQLAKKRYGRVILLEKGPLGDGSSSRAAAIITGLLWSETGIRARKKSLALYRELSQELPGYTFYATGCLNLFDQRGWDERRALLPLYDRLAAPYEILDAAELRYRWPQLTPRDDDIGLFDPLGGYSEPDEYLPALAAQCRALGVEIRENVQVGAIVVRDGHVAGVETAGGMIQADAVVSAVYAWTLRVLEPLGVVLPVKAFVHQRYVTEPVPAPVELPAINANALNGYARPAGGNRLLGGVETSERVEYRVTSNDFRMSSLTAAPGLETTLKQDLATLVPAIDGVAWASQHVGLITFASDGEPILGPIARLPGLFVGVAFHSGGFAYNPVAGMLLAEYIADGTTSIDVSAFSPDRFDPQEAAAYLATDVEQRHAFRRRH